MVTWRKTYGNLAAARLVIKTGIKDSLRYGNVSTCMEEYCFFAQCQTWGRARGQGNSPRLRLPWRVERQIGTPSVGLCWYWKTTRWTWRQRWRKSVMGRGRGCPDSWWRPGDAPRSQLCNSQRAGCSASDESGVSWTPATLEISETRFYKLPAVKFSQNNLKFLFKM